MKRNERTIESVVIGFDTETMRGPPITLQFYSEHTRVINGCVFLGKQDPTTVFLKRLKLLPPGRYRMYCHNLEFDMISILWKHRDEIKDGSIDLTTGSWRWKGRYSKPIFCAIDDGVRHVELVDSMLWFAESLEQAARRACPHLPKLTRPKDLGEKLFDDDDSEFVDYAMRDAEVAFFLGVEIEGFHKELEIAPQISLASMAATVFRQHYMQAHIYQPPVYDWMAGAAASYHGGMNRLPGHTPSWHTNVTSLDLSSAYPHAMTLFPDFSDPNGYKTYKQTRLRALKDVPMQGVYCVSGRADSCHWPALFDHNFQPLKGLFKDVWVTGYELNEALRADEIALTSLKGYYYEAKARSYSPFEAYAKTFYKLKSDATKGKTVQYMYKIVLNALTGKFIQTHTDWTLVDGELLQVSRAGGLYHPFIASLITGHTRSRMHALEHQYEALHTATDGIIVPHYVTASKKKELGAVVEEAHGDVALFRNKLYIFYTENPPEGSNHFGSRVFGEKKRILKFAKHGFHKDVYTLERMLVSPEREYEINWRVPLKTAMRGDGIPNKFVMKKRTLNVDTEFKVFNHA